MSGSRRNAGTLAPFVDGYRNTQRPREAMRLPAVATLILAAPRGSELCRLEEPAVDLPARRIRMPRVKPNASGRVVPLVPGLHEILLAALALPWAWRAWK
jgi:hypothetical protein